jgi:hypothetical protein
MPVSRRNCGTKIFGLNAAKVYGLSADEVRKYTRSDFIARARLAYAEDPQPHFATYGPKTRREFLQFMRGHQAPV